MVVEDPRDFRRLDPGRDFSRLLYSNPVCLLTTQCPRTEEEEEEGAVRHNVMTISWLTAVNNVGLLTFSINKARFTRGNLQEAGAEFCLSVPSSTAADLVLAIGKTSGRRGDKFAHEALRAAGLNKVLFAPRTAGGGGASSSSSSSSSSSAAASGRVQNAFALLGDDSDEDSDNSDDDDDDDDDEQREEGSGKKKGEDVEQVASASAASVGPCLVGGCVAWMRCRVVSILDDVPGDEPFQTPPPPRRQSRKGGGGGAAASPPTPPSPEPAAGDATAAAAATITTTSQHSLVIAQVVEAGVHDAYWDGKTFATTDPSAAPPHLTFLGSQEFGTTERLSEGKGTGQ